MKRRGRERSRRRGCRRIETAEEVLYTRLGTGRVNFLFGTFKNLGSFTFTAACNGL